jgi:hypothetical protein
VKNALENLLSTFGALGRRNWSGRSDLDFLVLKTRFMGFDRTAAIGIEMLARDLIGILFEASQKGDVGDIYLVMFLDTKLLRKLRIFIDDMLAHDPAHRSERQEVIDYLKTWMQNTAGSAALAIQVLESAQDRAAMRGWIDDLETARQDFERALSAKAAAETAMQAADEALSARDRAREAAGDTGAAALGGHFKEIADDEGKTAFWWTVTTVVSLTLVIGAGILIIFRSVYTQWVETLLHLAVVLPILALATFSARLARYHRLLGRWAKTAAVQINSIGAFAEQLPTANAREELILTLGRTVFGPPVFADDSKTESVSSIPPDVIDLLKEIVRNRKDIAKDLAGK